MGGLLPVATTEKNGLMSKTDKIHQPISSSTTMIYIGSLSRVDGSSNRADVILELSITSNGNGTAYALISFAGSGTDDISFNVILKHGGLISNIMKYKINGNSIDLYCERDGINLTVRPIGIGKSSIFNLKMSPVDSIPEDAVSLRI